MHFDNFLSRRLRFFSNVAVYEGKPTKGGPRVRPENLLTSPRGLSPGSRRGFLVGGRHESASAGILLSRIFFEALNSSEPQGPSASPLFRTRLGFEA